VGIRSTNVAPVRIRKYFCTSRPKIIDEGIELIESRRRFAGFPIPVGDSLGSEIGERLGA